MFSKYYTCPNCWKTWSDCYPKGEEILKELQGNDSFTLKADGGFLFSESDIDNEKIINLKSFFDKETIDGEYKDLSDMMKEQLGLYKHLTCTSQDIWFVLYAILFGGFEYVDCEKTNVKKSNKYNRDITGITSITVQKGSKYDEWYDEWLDIDECLEESSLYCPSCGAMRFVRNPRVKRMNSNKKLIEYVQECKDTSMETINKKELSSEKDVVDYLKHLVAIENSITFFSELYCRNLEGWTDYKYELQEKEKGLRREKRRLFRNNEAEIRKIEENIEEEKAIMDNQQLLARKYSVQIPNSVICPQEPAMQKPSYPMLKEAGLFNKSKVKAENEMLLATYNRELDRYNSAWEEYKKALDKYEENEKIKVTFEEQYPSLQLKQQEQITQFNTKKEELIQKRTEFNVEGKETNLTQIQEYKYMFFYQDELEEVKDILCQLVRCREQLHSLGVIFPKYLEYTPLLTILEYYESGRCSELTGADGAYNLYESELRQGVIIGKLDNVIGELNNISNKLDEIKNNQYLIYSSIENLNNSIGRLERTLEQSFKEVSSSLDNIEKNTTSIKEHTAMTAYYSVKTAEYTKRNAELTNALGYLVAFK